MSIGIDPRVYRIEGLYLSQLEKDSHRILDKTHTLANALGVKDEEVRAQLHIEATALACYWIREYSRTSGNNFLGLGKLSEMLIKQSLAYQRGHVSRGFNFVANRVAYYKFNSAGLEPAGTLFDCWQAIVNFSVLFKQMKNLALIGESQPANQLLRLKNDDLNQIQNYLEGLDPRSEEYRSKLKKWLFQFTSYLASDIASATSTLAMMTRMYAEVRESGAMIEPFGRLPVIEDKKNHQSVRVILVVAAILLLAAIFIAVYSLSGP